MSDYGYERRHGGHRTRPRSPEYVQETTYVERGAIPHRDLVYRGREDSIEDIPRDFPPPGGAAYTQTRYRESYAPRRARSVGRRDYPEDQQYYGQGDHGRRPPSRGRDRDGYYSDEDDKPRNRRRKSIVDQVKNLGEGLGLGGVIGAVSGRRSRSRSRGPDRHDDRRRDRRDRSVSRDRGGKERWEQAAKAAIVAGAVEAFRSRKEPGKWTGDKGQRVATAALGAAGLGKFLEKEHDGGDKHEKRHIAEAALGGLVANRMANGPRSRSRGGSDGSRSRSQSRTRSRSRSRIRSILGRDRSESRGRDRDDKDHTVRNVAGAGAAMAAGKAIYDRIRSKSRGRKDKDKDRANSPSSEDSHAPSRGRRYKEDRRDRGGPSEGAGRRRDGSHSSTSSSDLDQQKRKLKGGNQYGQTTYADANPYGAVPPPPMGGGMRY